MPATMDVWAPKMVTLLERLSKGSIKCVDESYYDKLLAEVCKEIDSTHSFAPMHEIINWFVEKKDMYPKMLEDPTTASFYIRILAVFAGRIDCMLKYYEQLGLLVFFGQELCWQKSPIVRHSYITALLNLSGHASGRNWIIEEKRWKSAVCLATKDNSLYVRRQATALLKALLKAENTNQSFTMEVLHDIVDPIRALELKSPDCDQEDVGNIVGPYLKLIDALCEDCIEIEKGNLVPSLLIEEFHLDDSLKRFLEELPPHAAMVSTYAHILLTALPSEVPVEEEHPYVVKVFEMLKTMVRFGRHVCFLLQLCRVSHILWLKLKKRRPKASAKTEMEFFAIQLMPLIVSLRKCNDNMLLDHHVSKLLELTSEGTFRLAYMARDAIDVDPAVEKSVKAIAAIHGVMDYFRQLDHEKIVLLYQTLIWLLKQFCPTTTDENLEKEISEVKRLCALLAPVVDVTFVALNKITEEFEVSWMEANEGVYVTYICGFLLKWGELPTKTAVLAFRLLRLSLRQQFPLHLNTLTDSIEHSILHKAIDLLSYKLHDPNWEIRDSAMEVLTTFIENSHEKIPSMQRQILDCKMMPLVLAVMQGDAEGYVRASALKALKSAACISSLWVACPEAPEKVLKLLRTDTEGIVRQEAVLVVERMLQYKRIPKGLLQETFSTMLKITMNDLHWEVRVNSLDFWSRLIELRLHEQGMVDGAFPSVTFSRESKKIIALTETEIKLRLNKVLEEVSQAGCFNAILLTLDDECDTSVMRKASQVAEKLFKLLKVHNIVPLPVEDVAKRKLDCDFESRNRKIIINGESSRIDEEELGASSAQVIEDIVGTSDVNLLAGVVGNSEESEGLPGKEPIEMIDVHTFLIHLQDKDFSLLSNSSKCTTAINLEDICGMLDSVLSLSEGKEENNIPDCY